MAMSHFILLTRIPSLVIAVSVCAGNGAVFITGILIRQKHRVLLSVSSISNCS